MATITETTIDIAKQDRHNANKGTERGEAALDDSLTQFGAGRSLLLDKNGELIAGNKTQRAAIKAGLTRMIIVETTGDEVVAVKRTDLDLSSTTDKRARQLAYYDNQVQALDYELDLEQLVIDLDNGVDLTGLWNEDEMAELLEQVADGLLGGAGEGDGQHYADKNKEINIDDIEDAMTITLKFTEEDYWKVKNGLSSIADTPEEAVLKLLGHE